MVNLPQRAANTHSPGIVSFLPVRSLDGHPAWGRIHQTQVNKPGQCPMRAINVPSTLPRSDSTVLYKISLLKCSLSGAQLVRPRFHSDGAGYSYNETQRLQHKYRSVFFATFLNNFELEKEFWGPNIILGRSHTHFSFRDERSSKEQAGKYLPQPAIPAKFVVNQLGRTVPWVSPPLSDSRSIGDWKGRFNRYYVRDDVEEDSTHVSELITIHRVGRHVLAWKF